MSERGRDGWQGEELFGVGARELKLFLRRADPVIRMGVAEPQKAVEIHARASLDEGCKPTSREARRAEPVEVEMGADRRIALRCVERGCKVSSQASPRRGRRRRRSSGRGHCCPGGRRRPRHNHAAPSPFQTTP